MQIVIDIPEEFEKHFNFDNFENSLERIKLDVVDSIYCTEASSSGKYEIETIDMLIKAFKECTPLPKGHGELKDADAMINKLCTHEASELFGSTTCAEIMDFINGEKPIIEADKEKEERYEKM